MFPNGIPNVSAVVRGKTVYDPRTGLTAWSANPALCVRDYLVTECGVDAARIPDGYVIAAANACDETVTLADGSTQARYTCNGVLDTGVSRRDNLQALLTSMAGEVVRVGTEVRLFAGAYDSPAGSITDDLLAGDLSVRARTPRADLTNTVRGTYVDPDKGYQPTDFPPVTNATYVSQDAGVPYPKDLELPFTTHPEAAQRIAKLILEKARQGITVDVPLNHAALKFSTWDTITYTQDHLGWAGKVFRIKSIRMDSVPDGAIRLTLQEESSASYDWNAGEATAADPAPDTNLPDPTVVAAPGTPAVTESLYVTTDGSGVKTKAAVTWGASSDAFLKEYQPEYKLTSATDYTVLPRTTATTAEVADIAPGEYAFRVKAVNTLGVSSAYAAGTAEVVGLTAPPADLQNLSLNVISSNVHLSWDQAADLDVRVGGSVRIRHSKDATGATWANAIDIGPALPGVATQAVLPLLSGTYLAKAVDSAGNESVAAATITTTVPDIVKMNTVATLAEHPAFAGTRDDTVVVDGVLQIDSVLYFDGVAGNFDAAAGNFDYGTAGVTSTARYTFAAPADVGRVSVCRVTARLALTVSNVNDLFDDRQGTFDDATGLFDGDDLTGVAARLEVRTTTDDPSGSPAWSAWRPFFVGDYTARGFDFRLALVNESPDLQAFVSELSVTVDMPDVVDQGTLTTSGAGLTAVTYARTFVSTPTIGTTVKNGATGDYLEVTATSATGFQVGVKNAGGSYVARNIDWVARGY